MILSLNLGTYASKPLQSNAPQHNDLPPINIIEEGEDKTISESEHNNGVVIGGVIWDNNQDRSISNIQDQQKFQESKHKKLGD